MSNPPALVSKSGAVALAGPADAAPPALMEYQSPTASVIARPVPLASRFTSWVVLATFSALLAVLGLMPIDRVVTASGKVSAVNGNLSVQPFSSVTLTISSDMTDVSLVRAIHVKEGQLVRAGEVLAELDPTNTLADAGSLQTLVASLQAEVDRLTAETQNRPYVPDGTEASMHQALLYEQRHAERAAKAADFAQKIKVAEVAIAGGMAQVATLNARKAGAHVVEHKRRELRNLRVGSDLDLLAATDNRVNIEAQLADAQASIDLARRQLDDLVAQRDDDMQTWLSTTSQSLTDQGRLLSDAREQLKKALLRRDMVQLRAPKDAIVLRLAPVSVGTVLQPGQEFINLVPLDAPLQVDAIVAGADVGFVRVGDPVTIKFETFPYALYGTATGTVQAISPDSFSQPTSGGTSSSTGSSTGGSTGPGGSAPSTSLGAPQQGLNQPTTTSLTSAQQALGVLYFLARMSIDELQLHDLPDGARVVPGMPVEADIRVGKRTVIDYLISLVEPAVTESMREP